MMFEIPLPLRLIFATWLRWGYRIDWICSWYPWAAVCIEALKIALNLLIRGTITMGVGGSLPTFWLVFPLYFHAQSSIKGIKQKACPTLVWLQERSVWRYRTSELFHVLPAYSYFYEPAAGSHLNLLPPSKSNINGLLCTGADGNHPIQCVKRCPVQHCLSSYLIKVSQL